MWYLPVLHPVPVGQRPGVRINAAGLVREISKHTQELSQMVVDHGGAETLVRYLSSDPNNQPLNVFMASGFIASFSQSLPTGLIKEGGCSVVIKGFTDREKGYVNAVSAWTIGQIGKHSSEHALHLIYQNGLTQLHEAHLDRHASHDLQIKTKWVLKLIINIVFHIGLQNA
jgi:hypothetical protein